MTLGHDDSTINFVMAIIIFIIIIKAAPNAGTIRYDTRCYFNVRSKADMNQLNLPYGNDN